MMDSKFKPIKLKRKHYKLINHFVRFVDKVKYPDYTYPSLESIQAFFKQQSYGPNSLTQEEQWLIEPLMDAQVSKELTIKMIHEEMFEWWSKSWGWIYPILDDIKHEFKDRHNTKDTIFIKMLIEIVRKLRKESAENPATYFIDFMMSFSGVNFEHKQKYVLQKL